MTNVRYYITVHSAVWHSALKVHEQDHCWWCIDSGRWNKDSCQSLTMSVCVCVCMYCSNLLLGHTWWGASFLIDQYWYLMGLVRIRPHSSHGIANQPSHSVDSSGWQAKNAASIELWIPWRKTHRPMIIIWLRSSWLRKINNLHSWLAHSKESLRLLRCDRHILKLGNVLVHTVHVQIRGYTKIWGPSGKHV